MVDLIEKLEQADGLLKSEPQAALDTYRKVVAGDVSAAPKGKEGAYSRAQQAAIVGVARALTKLGKHSEVVSFFSEMRSGVLQGLPRSRTGKVVRDLLDAVDEEGADGESLASLCESAIEWGKEDKRVFLIQKVEAKLAQLLLRNHKYNEGITLVRSLIHRVKKLDDKLLLVDLFLLESKFNFAVKNLPKAKASLASARTAGTTVCIEPPLQAYIDLQGGHLCSFTGEHKTAYSYYYECFEARSLLKDKKETEEALCFMLLTKVMQNRPAEVAGILRSRLVLPFQGSLTEAFSAIAKAAEARSIQDFNAAREKHSDCLARDLVSDRLDQFYDKLVTAHLLRVVEPYSRVDLAHLAHLTQLPVEEVQGRLSRLILDGEYHGVLDEGNGWLVAHPPAEDDVTFPVVLETVASLTNAVEALKARATLIHH